MQFALNPDVMRARAPTRPLTNLEYLQRASAICASRPSVKHLSCSGELFVGMFFDGTGNNEEADFKAPHQGDRKQSNVVRLYHAYKIVRTGATQHHSHYVPGVGTPFPDIADSGGKVGTATSYKGEARIIWGLMCVINSVSRYLKGADAIPRYMANRLANSLDSVFSPGAERSALLQAYIHGLGNIVRIRAKNLPKLNQINLSVYGFSRGAAQTRAFVSWIYELCEKTGGGYTFADIPFRVEFVGIFDTVASVGMAGAFTNGLIGFEGRQSWAYDNMQIHEGVESCVHMAAAHEVRATFPMDSVRILGKYPPNVKEYVYPGSHSNVGGGYGPREQGKCDSLARIPGFDMYCAALSAGVPFESFSGMPASVRNALVPTEQALRAFQSYMTVVNIKPAPVEDMMLGHMAMYFNYRYHGRRGGPGSGTQAYLDRGFANRNSLDKPWLQKTQNYFIEIVSQVVTFLEKTMAEEDSFSHYVPHPYIMGLPLPSVVGIVASLSVAKQIRSAASDRPADNLPSHKNAGRAPEVVLAWKRWLDSSISPDLVDDDAPERTIMKIISILHNRELDKAVTTLFDEYVHDSAAGLAKQGMHEFLYNGIGLCKYRRVYFGDTADRVVHDAAEAHNDAERKKINSRRAQVKQWHLEAEQYKRTR